MEIDDEEEEQVENLDLEDELGDLNLSEGLSEEEDDLNNFSQLKANVEAKLSQVGINI